MIISAKINVSKIDKNKMFTGKTGTFLDITLLANKQGRDQYGQDGMVVQDIGRAARERGEKGAILGNYKIMGQDKPASAGRHESSHASAPHQDPHETDDIPF